MEVPIIADVIFYTESSYMNHISCVDGMNSLWLVVFREFLYREV